MSFWRPGEQCFYVIPDIHGRKIELELILKRILPLRKFDKIIFLGDYIDRGPSSKDILDILISLKEKYKDQIITLLGNHEWLMLASLNKLNLVLDKKKISPFAVWMKNGGANTIYSYAKGKMSFEECFNSSSSIVNSYVSDKHINFLLDCPVFVETNDYIFVHAGCEPEKPLEYQSNDVLLWDRSLFEVCALGSLKDKKFPWKKTIVCGHSYAGPLLLNNYYMLDGSSKNRLYCMELFSKEIYFAEEGNSRLVKSDFINYNKYSGNFKFTLE